MDILLMGVAVAAAAGLGWWLLIASEGVYLGRRTVVWLYDLYAQRYDSIKGYRSVYEHMFLAQPLMEAIAPHKSPLMLDVATGTGRLPIAMINHAHFNGHVIGVDLSRRMLAEAARKAMQERRVTFIHAPAEALPFPDSQFDVVTCLEALEFMIHRESVLRELVRVIRAGGILLITNRIGEEARLMPGKIWEEDALVELLLDAGMHNVRVERWQVDYDLVWAVKAGESPAAGVRPMTKILRCPTCMQTAFNDTSAGYVCGKCGLTVAAAADGVLEIPL